MSAASKRSALSISFLLSVSWLTFSFLPEVAAAVTGYVRVSQIGYEAGLPARAYVMTTRQVSSVMFKVINSVGRVVASGSVGARLGSWAAYSVYPIDFTITAPDTYTIGVSGPVSATSPSFPVDAASNLYTPALANALYFYETERDGPNFIPTELRTAAGHLNDATAAVYQTPSFDGSDLILEALRPTGAKINADGGWWDAGDYLKFVQTTSYAVAEMLVGIRDFPEQLGAGSATSNFTNEAKFGLDWLQQMWDDSNQTLYYQVGIGTDFRSYNYQSDHDIWRLPQKDDTYGGTDPQYKYIRNRPVFVAGAAGSKISPNLAGRLAADFALCFRVYQGTDTAYANQCLLAAEHIFDLANTAPSGHLLTVAPWDFYQETEWRDDLELAATELYFAIQGGNLPQGLPHTDPNYYLARAANWAHAYIHSSSDGTDTLNLYDVSGLAHFELYRALVLAGNPTNLAVKEADLTNDIANQITTSISQANDPFGSGYGWSFSDTVSHVAGLSVMADEFFFLTSDPSYATDARRWLANIHGTNAWGSSFVVNEGSRFPFCMQHQVANLMGSTDGRPPVLSGAVVEGPTSAHSSGLVQGMVTCPSQGGDAFKKFNGKGAVYKDNVQSYTTVEPAIDLASNSLLMYAWRIAGKPAGKP